MEAFPAFRIVSNVKRTRLASVVADRLATTGQAVVTRYGIFRILLDIAQTPKGTSLLRAQEVEHVHIKRVVQNLQQTGGLGADPDYRRNVYRVLSIGDASAEEVFALATPFGYVSHLSAMQRWGLTVRRPNALHLTLPAAGSIRLLVSARMRDELSNWMEKESFKPPVHLTHIRPPDVLRGRKIAAVTVKTLGSWIVVRGTCIRLSTIGQTFLDMIERPELCGGMAHVRDVWKEHAETHLEEIIATVDKAGSPIVKVRAGYLLDEWLGIGTDLRIKDWARFAQRGSSRVLDPARPFASTYSEKWMLSLNVQSAD